MEWLPSNFGLASCAVMSAQGDVCHLHCMQFKLLRQIGPWLCSASAGWLPHNFLSVTFSFIVSSRIPHKEGRDHIGRTRLLLRRHLASTSTCRPYTSPWTSSRTWQATSRTVRLGKLDLIAPFCVSASVTLHRFSWLAFLKTAFPHYGINNKRRCNLLTNFEKAFVLLQQNRRCWPDG